MRPLLLILLGLDALLALGGVPMLVIALAYVRLDGAAHAAAAAAFAVCWVLAPWGALLLAGLAWRRGVPPGRLAVLLLIPPVAALIGQALLERMPTWGV